MISFQRILVPFVFVQIEGTKPFDSRSLLARKKKQTYIRLKTKFSEIGLLLILTFLLVFYVPFLFGEEKARISNLTPPENCWTVIIDVQQGSFNGKEIEKFLKEIEARQDNTVIFSYINKGQSDRLPTLTNIRSLLDWLSKPDERSSSLKLDKICQNGTGLCEVRLFITAYVGMQSDKLSFFFPDEKSAIPVEEFSNALNGDGNNLIDRRLLFVNMLSHTGPRSGRSSNSPQGSSSSFISPDVISNAIKSPEVKKTKSEGFIYVQNQSLKELHRVDSFYNILYQGINGRADGFNRNSFPDGQVSMYELIDYVRSQFIKSNSEAIANIKSGHLGADYGISPSSWKELKPPVGIFLEIGEGLNKLTDQPYQEDVIESLNRELKNRKIKIPYSSYSEYNGMSNVSDSQAETYLFKIISLTETKQEYSGSVYQEVEIELSSKETVRIPLTTLMEMLSENK